MESFFHAIVKKLLRNKEIFGLYAGIFAPYPDSNLEG